MSLPDVLRELITTPGPSGYEDAPAAVFRSAASAFGATVTGDTLASSVARVAARPAGDGPGGLTVAVVGHIDEIGLIVRHVDDKGFIWFNGVGGWDPVNLVGQRVDLLTRGGRLAGVIGKKPIHLLKEDDRKKPPKLTDLHIDIGSSSREETERSVRVGDVAVLAAEPLELPNGRYVSRSMDNRLGCFVALEAARLVAEAGGAPGDVCAVAVAQEEITFGGAHTTAFSLRPDIAIVVDVTHATDAPGIEERENGSHPFGSGPVITRGSTLHPVVTDGLIDVAVAEGIPHTLDASSRSTGTDADAFHLSRAGIPTAVVSVPLRYMHSSVEMVQLDDVENAARLIAAYAQSLTSPPDLVR